MVSSLGTGMRNKYFRQYSVGRRNNFLWEKWDKWTSLTDSRLKGGLMLKSKIFYRIRRVEQLSYTKVESQKTMATDEDISSRHID